MVCPHGLSEVECIHCRMQTGVKPPMQLVHPAPTELPMAIPTRNALEQPKNIQHSDLFSERSTLSNMPIRLTRNFDLHQSSTNTVPSLFQQRMDVLTARHQAEKAKVSINPEVPIVDLKKRFLQVE